MEKQNVNKVNDEIDLVRLVKVLIKRKWLIIGGTLAFTMAALIISLLLPKVYKSSAFFQLSSGSEVNLEELTQIQNRIRDNLHNDLLYNLTLAMILEENFEDIEMMMKNVSFPDYKKYSALFSDPYRFARFLEQKAKAGDKEAGELRHKGTSMSIAQCIEPIYAFSKKDLKELTLNPRDSRNFVVGVQLKAEKERPEQARAFLNALGEFIRDSILLSKLEDYITAQWNKSQEEYKKFDNLMINAQFKLQQLTTKRNDMELLLKKYPESKGTVVIAGQEWLPLDKDKNGYRYLSPAAQLVGVESYIADIKENLSQNQRDKQLVSLKFDFFSKIKEIKTAEEHNMSGYSYLASIMKSLNSFFDEKKLADTDNTARQVKNELLIDFDKFRTVYEEMQFLSGPTLSHTPVKPKKTLFLAVGFILGLFLSVFLAFVIDWWTLNKQE